jgi:hypothetical protein
MKSKRNLDQIIRILQGKRRPEPEKVLQFTDADIKEALTQSEQYNHDPDSLQNLRNSVTIATEVESLLPIIARLVGHIREQYSGHTLLFAGRDAEPLYDAFRVSSDNEARGKIYLFPGSNMLMTDLMRGTPKPIFQDCIEHECRTEHGIDPVKVRQAYKKYGRDFDYEAKARQIVSKFLSHYGINEESIRQGEKFLVIDTGFKGTIAGKLNCCIQTLYSLEYEEANKIIIPRLVAKWDGEDAKKYTAKEFMSFDDQQSSLKDSFPKTEPEAKKYCSTANFCIAMAMQLLPHYHAPYSEIDMKARPQTHKHGAGCYFEPDIDKVTGDGQLDPLNISIVNPLGALLVQRRVAQYFSKSNTDSFS